MEEELVKVQTEEIKQNVGYAVINHKDILPILAKME